MPEHRVDSELMRRAASGHREDFEALIRRYADDLLTFLVRMLSDYHLAEEAFQEVFLSVWTKRATYQYPRPVKPWLYRIAHNQCRAYFRRSRLPTEGDTDISHLPGDSDTCTTAIRNEDARLMQLAISQLPERQRAVIAMRVGSNLSYREIAESIGLTEPTVRSHMHHALQALRNQLTKKQIPNSESEV